MRAVAVVPGHHGSAHLRDDVPDPSPAKGHALMLGNRLVFGTVNAGRGHFEAGARDLEITEARLPGWLPHLITRRLPFTDVAKALVRRPEDIKTVLVFH